MNPARTCHHYGRYGHARSQCFNFMGFLISSIHQGKKKKEKSRKEGVKIQGYSN
jgi:hypothetical protein